ncbi:hypothetical protein [Evansella cellulosilytica]|uniref:Uncharacterized protein n=1 Tax=Evansella cellulosilytica (strain ATCC 21833 / DSM 2522 / FERM P-1141 / JCM 9156 / N-4) TaxID=649639 RepID=E6TR82_EVAC2|nr:hypothetical protein [Evansella cellulosilytica]ADU30594.1 hypothetical protein Bcell_2335 [Evansella cellulosilytica DSM 2522]
MAKYRRKPIIVDAVKITREMTINSSKGTLKGEPGDYLVTELNGEQYPCSAKEFENNYVPTKSWIDVKGVIKRSFKKLKIKTKEIVAKS